MPIHSYKCPFCGDVTADVWTVSTRPTDPVCEQCGHVMVLKLGSFEPRFIGSGFYETDYKKKASNGKQTTDSRD